MEDPGGNIFDFDNEDGEYFSPNCKFFITTALGLSILKGSVLLFWTVIFTICPFS